MKFAPAAALLLCLAAPQAFAQAPSPVPARAFRALAASAAGIHGIDRDGRATPLWTDGEVRKILRAGDRWFAYGERGIVSSADLASWQRADAGLPVKTVKEYDGTRKAFVRVPQEIKDLEASASDPRVLAAATKDAVFLTRDGGATWKDLGTPVRTNGLKAVAVASLPSTIVFVTHAIYGVHWIDADKPGARWTELNAGLEKLETTGNPDEVSDLAVAAPAGAAPSGAVIYAAQTFKGRIYRLDWETKAFRRIWTDGADFGTAESLAPEGSGLRFTAPGGIAEIDPSAPAPAAVPRTDLDAAVARASAAVGAPVNCLLPEGGRPLGELWLLGDRPRDAAAARRERAAGKEGLYLPTNHAVEPRLLQPYLKTIESRGLDMVVVDMKDDYGRLRFVPRDPAIAAKGRVFNPVDLEAFAAAMKARGVWLVARIVVFKDPELAKKEGGKYAVWDAAANAPWVGYYNAKKKKEPAAASAPAAPSAAPAAPAPQDASASAASAAPAAEEFETVKTFYDERWVDPYSEEVWEYTAALSRELVSRGFDEIQFDYIRFPTDGINLGDARYRWKDAGMDMESAIMSFLSHVRSRVDAPISIDIYGANGWYRTGARTGQEVELLSHYVDVICPMYYPSHFEQAFLADEPSELRPFRIYHRGTLRTDRIARGRVVVRPYVQAFFLNVSYDRKYYGPDYVRRQVEGVRQAGGPGLTYWNNVGRYDDIPLPTDVKAAKGEGPAPDAGRKALD